MTTNTTNSQAASIDTPDFQALMNKMMGRLRTADLTGYNLDVKAWGDAMNEVVAHIDAKLAQAREEGILFERKRLVQTIGNANDLSSECLKQRDEANARAIAAESRLAEIQRGVEGLLQYIADHDWGGIPEPVPQIDALRALLQPQGQADTSGLSG